jgi:hypothetical protein
VRHTLRFLGAKPQPRCVCGHTRAAHRHAVMSVPLKPNTNPLYEVPTGMYNNVAAGHPHASFEGVQCGCGCTIWEPL